MTYSVRHEGRIYVAERLLYTAPKGCVPVGFAPTHSESIPVTIKGGSHPGASRDVQVSGGKMLERNG